MHARAYMAVAGAPSGPASPLGAPSQPEQWQARHEEAWMRGPSWGPAYRELVRQLI